MFKIKLVSFVNYLQILIQLIKYYQKLTTGICIKVLLSAGRVERITTYGIFLSNRRKDVFTKL